MRTSAVVSIVVLIGCSSGDPTPDLGGVAPPVAAPATMLAKADVERDLALELRRVATEPVDHERDPRVEVWLVNRSATQSYPAVLANDGSEVGWREPHAFFTEEYLRPSGVWEAPPWHELLRCGNYAADWTKDLVTLAPGERVKMPWMPFYGPELGDATKVRIVAHYEYGEHARDKTKVPPALHATPSFSLASSAIEIPIAHPYALELLLKGALPTTAKAPLAAAVDVVVENRSQGALPVGTSETGAQLWFEAVFAGRDGKEKTRTLFADTEPT